ncbi:MAG: glycosyltransferase [Sporocytophaga sp.]|uniref:glycosyltransferase n=1 Tax=Sporocytophaga sp. TaxID=2231183 RepID=UPI001B1B6686|nr:glycosyltransferase [Sporocytophaga sp.]MBO9700317.1 glycosyltransferase [Sporocytophaga sp.]
MRRYSVVIPIYNRPDEIKELLESLTKQTYKNFDVVIVEDGSSIKCEGIVNSFKSQLEVAYYYKENTGQGFSRNYGYERAKGDYFVVFDSDCIIPANYFEELEKALNENYLDAFGGPDKSHPSFTDIQKAISYSMTSLFTTGGIRGNKKSVGVFHPRSFNMGISRQVFEKTRGYIITRMGEDIEFSIRILNSGFKSGLIENAFVYHKRRTNFSHFFKQLHFFGRARINIYRFFPSELKPIHFMPAVFTLFCAFTILFAIFRNNLFYLCSGILLLYSVLILIDATIKNRSLKIGFLSVAAVYTQLTGYGIGFLTELKRELIKEKK